MHFADGFTSVEDLFMWPDAAWDAVVGGDSAALASLRTLADRQAFMYSFYSGKGTDATMSTYFNRSFAKKGLVEPGRKVLRANAY